MMSPELETAFAEAKERVLRLKKKPSNEALLKLYGLFKQSTEGDVHGEVPGVFDFVGKAKYNAWESLRGLDKAEAMRRYIGYVDQLLQEEADAADA